MRFPLILFLLVNLVLIYPLNANAQLVSYLSSPKISYLEIENINHKVLAKEIELFKLNTYFRVENGKDRPGKRLRIMFYQNANYFLTFTGLLINVLYNFIYWKKLRENKYGPVLPGEVKHIPTLIQLAATLPRFVGKAILISGTIFESTLEGIDKNSEKKRGFNINTVDSKVIGLKNDIDSLLAKRQRLLAQAYDLSDKEKEVANLDTKLMAEGRDLGLTEYVNLHARSVYRTLYNRSENSLTLAKKFDGDFGSDLVRIISACIHDDYLNPVSSTSTTISGSMSALNPLAELAIAHIGKNKAKKAMAQKLNQAQADLSKIFEADSDKFNSLIASTNDNDEPYMLPLAKLRAELYKQESGVYGDMQYIDSREAKSEKRHQKHSIIMHQIYGWSKASRGMFLIYVGYHFIQSPRFATLLTGEAGIINLAGASIRLADTFRTDTIDFLKRREIAAQKTVTGTILQGRLSTLDSMEESIEASNNLPRIKNVPKS